MRAALVTGWLGAAAIAAITAGSCSIEHRSGDFECDENNECPGNRDCVDGFCEPGEEGAPDARRVDAPKLPDADICPSICTTCDPGTMECIVDCQFEDCGPAVVCPSGWNCDIRCNVQNACRNSVFCQSAASCEISCSGDSACRDIQCGAGRCSVTCSGSNSCRGVDCDGSCGCDVFCTGFQSCWDAITCTDSLCDTGLGCSSSPPGCYTCPG